MLTELTEEYEHKISDQDSILEQCQVEAEEQENVLEEMKNMLPNPNSNPNPNPNPNPNWRR